MLHQTEHVLNLQRIYKLVICNNFKVAEILFAFSGSLYCSQRCSLALKGGCRHTDMQTLLLARDHFFFSSVFLTPPLLSSCSEIDPFSIDPTTGPEVAAAQAGA